MPNPFGTRDDWTHPGLRAIVLLHEKEMRRFMQAWRRAHDARFVPPESTDQDTARLENLLFHVLRAGGYYLEEVCRMLDLPDPGLPEPPTLERILDVGPTYFEELLTGWHTPLRDVTQRQADLVTGEVSWGVTYCVDALLEHAVMHPMRHTLQLDEWWAGR